MFSIEEQIYLLSVIEEDGDVIPLTKTHSYDEILKEIKSMIAKGWVEHGDKLMLTEDGRKAIKKLLK